MKPSLPIGQRVQYTHEGILHCVYGVVRGHSWDAARDCWQYQVEWEQGGPMSRYSYPREFLQPLPKENKTNEGQPAGASPV